MAEEDRTPNPFTQSTVLVSIPEAVEVRLVEAGTLTDYEVWASVTSVLASAVVGFVVAFFQAAAGDGGILLVNAGVFGLLMLMSGITALKKRRRMTASTKQLRFRVGEQV